MSNEGLEFGSESNLTQQEYDRYVQECERLAGAWNTFLDRETDGPAVPSIHPPPALYAIVSSLFEVKNPIDALVQFLNLDDPVTYDAFCTAIGMTASLANTMFKYGQFCSDRRIRHESLTPCKCGSVTDDVLNKLLKEG